jgi:hypothetical protein
VSETPYKDTVRHSLASMNSIIGLVKRIARDRGRLYACRACTYVHVHVSKFAVGAKRGKYNADY